MGFKRFSLFDCDLDTHHFIEASAGTGKTFTLTGLFLRLLLEKNYSVDQILVVTFTRLATKELKERIYERLRKSVKALEKGDGGSDPWLNELVERFGADSRSLKILKTALREFDEAAIFTIHGFCQSVLTEESMLTGVPSGAEMIQSDLLLKVAGEDYWRALIDRYSGSASGRLLIEQIRSLADNPDQLVDLIHPAIEKQYATLIPAGDPDPLLKLKRYLELKEEMRRTWEERKEDIFRELEESDVSRMAGKLLEKRITAMEHFLCSEESDEFKSKYLKYFLPEYFKNNLKKRGSRLPADRFFELCRQFDEVADSALNSVSQFLSYSSDEIRSIRNRLQREQMQLTYQDLLNRLNESLERVGSGEKLARRLARRYPAALVDEFQDTDPVQYQIFSNIYLKKNRGGLLTLIGDPKQSIYRFRGADIHTYLKARDRFCEENIYTLKENFRSRPSLIKSVNRLVGRDHGSPFLVPGITAETVEPGGIVHNRNYLVKGEPPIPVKIYYSADLHSKGELREELFSELVRQIVEMLNRSASGDYLIDDGNRSEKNHRPLEARDIAVLVQSHMHAEQIKVLLRKAGVGAVTYTRKRVFETTEAERMERILSAIRNPASSSAVENALSSGFFGNTISGLQRWKELEESGGELTRLLEDLNDLWNQAGIYPVMRYLLFRKGALEKLVQSVNGPRVSANIQQLTELAANAEKRFELNPYSLLRWFRHKIAGDDSADEETLRLESDENLVTISTIHNSKGLEFPIVFLPDLWEVKTGSRNSFRLREFHPSDNPYELAINLELTHSEKRELADQTEKFEMAAEEARKCYVALTRAKYECRVLWGMHRMSHLSGLGAMLYGGHKTATYIEEDLNLKGKSEGGPGPEDFVRFFEQLSENHPSLFRLTQIEPETGRPGYRSPERKEKLERLSFTGRKVIRPAENVFSYSSIAQILKSDRMDDSIIRSDWADRYDEWADPYSVDTIEAVNQDQPLKTIDDESLDSGRDKDQEAGETVADRSMLHFPRGREAGIYIHKLFEFPRLDFTREETFHEAIEKTPSAENWGREWSEVLRKMMHDMVRADFGELNLNKVRPEDMVREMQFHFSTREVDYDGLYSIVRGEDGDPGHKPQGQQAHGRPAVSGFMTGFIDLIVRQNNRYYIVDYKSDFLGTDRQHYIQDQLSEVIRSAGYDLQYHLYTLALKRYLEERLSNFSYSTDFGGVYYLYVRGMERERSSGIFFDKPDERKIKKLEKLLYKSEDE